MEAGLQPGGTWPSGARNLERRSGGACGARLALVLRADRAGGHPLRSTYVVWTGAAPRLPIRPAAMGGAPRWADGGYQERPRKPRLPEPGKTQAAGWPSAHTYNIDGATKIEQRVLCVGSDETPYCSSRRLNYIRTFKAAATVVDVSPPGVTITQDNAFTRGEWVSGTQQVNYSTLDNVGVRAARAVFAGTSVRTATRPCNYAIRVPCPNGPGALTIDTASLTEGTQPMTLEVEDAAANRGRQSRPPCGSTTRRPERCLSRSTEATSGATATTLTWHGPIPTKATVRRSRPAATASARSVEPSASPIAGRVRSITSRTSRSRAPANGNSVCWREDAAGNQQPANASVPVTLRYDPEPPDLGFEEPSSGDPTLISALVTDKVSGLAGGEIELSAQGSGVGKRSPPVRKAAGYAPE